MGEAALLAELAALLPDDRLTTDPDVLTGYAHDDAEWAEWSLPACLVRPRTAEEVQLVVQACLRHDTAVVARGAGTGLSGGANALAGCVVISLERMDAVLEVDELERLAVVQPGVVNDDLRSHVAAHGLWYPPDPASSPWSTIGGNVATNAGGICLRQVRRHQGLRARDADRRPAWATWSGWDAEPRRASPATTSRVCSSDQRAPSASSQRSRCGCDRAPTGADDRRLLRLAHRRGEAVREVAAAGLTPSALELIDRNCLRAVDEWKKMGLSADAAVVLLGRVDTPGAVGEEEAAALLSAFQRGGATWADRCTDEAEAEALFAARRLAYPALERLGPVLTEDVCVPKAAVPEMLSRIERIAAGNDVHIANIAHAGDGNLHPLLVVPAGDDEARARA